jgi:hypothetical protein
MSGVTKNYSKFEILAVVGAERVSQSEIQRWFTVRKFSAEGKCVQQI